MVDFLLTHARGRMHGALIFVLIIATAMLPALTLSQSETEAPADVITPLPGRVTDNTLVVIVKPSTEKMEEATVKIISTATGETVDAKSEITKETNWMTAVDTRELEDGEHVVEVESCTATDCVTKEIPIRVDNSMKRREKEAASAEAEKETIAKPPPLFDVLPSNYFTAFSISPLNNPNQKIVSTGDKIQLEENTYVGKLVLFDTIVHEVTAENVNINHSGTFMMLTRKVIADAFQIGEKKYIPVRSVKIEWEYDGEYEVTLIHAPELDFFACETYDEDSRACKGEWQPVLSENNKHAVRTKKSPLYIVGGQPAIDEADVNMFSWQTAADLNTVIIAEDLTMVLDKEYSNYSGTDTPRVGVSVETVDGSGRDAELQAELTLPTGEVRVLDKKEIRATRTGKYQIAIPHQKFKQPGTYVLNVTAKTGTVELAQTISFGWGLIAVNTGKSTYTPGETAEFEVVVLDSTSFGVPHASVIVDTLSPSGKKERLSSNNGLVIETTSPGIYLARMKVDEEGTYHTRVRARAEGIDTSIDTTFDVREKIEYDIVRRTLTKMDPAHQPVEVELTVTPRTGNAENITVREFVPLSFEVDAGGWVTTGDETGDATTTWEDDPRVRVYENGEMKVIEWNNVEMSDGEARLVYYYTLPLVKPWLYFIGPIEVESGMAFTQKSADDVVQNSADQDVTAEMADVPTDAKKIVFTEARSWMIAVDDSNTSVFHFRNANDYDSGEPKPNVAISNDTFIGSSTEAIYGMHPTLGNNIFGKRTIPGTTSSGNYRAHNWTSPPLAAQTLASGTWTVNMWAYENGSAADLRARTTIWGWADSNDARMGPIQATPFESGEFGLTPGARITLSTTGSAITLSRKDKIVVEIDLRGITPASAAFADFNWDNSTRDGNLIFASPIELYRQFNVPAITIPTADNNTGIVEGEDFLIEATTTCDGNFFDCAGADTNLQWCAGAGCSNWADVNGSSGDITLTTGSNPDSGTILSGNTRTSSWVVQAATAGTYELRVSASGSFIDTNTSLGTDRTITIDAAAPPEPDYSFVVMLPSSGCSEDKGGAPACGADCQCVRGYFESTDLNGLSTIFQVEPEGQSQTIPFLVYDNQSTTSTDFNILLELNNSLNPSYVIKASKIYAGYDSTCTGDTDTNCVQISTISKSVGIVPYSSGTQDLNIFIWADFTAASAGMVDVNVNSSYTP